MRLLRVWVPDRAARNSRRRPSGRRSSCGRAEEREALDFRPPPTGARRRVKRGDIVTVVVSGDTASRAGGGHSIGLAEGDRRRAVALMTSALADAPIYRLTLEPDATNGLRVTTQVMVDKIVAVPRGNAEGCGAGREGAIALDQRFRLWWIGGLATFHFDGRQMSKIDGKTPRFKWARDELPTIGRSGSGHNLNPMDFVCSGSTKTIRSCPPASRTARP
ncbi:MAG: hypothetical protein H6870_14350 [Methylobacteriaceae bacterium]|nr:hypothetical protein [Methylobacteriaceae bacterium]